MATKNETVAYNAARQQIIDSLLSNQSEQANAGDTVRELLTDAVASSLDTAAAIGGALTGAWDNAKQVFALEQNFRAAERKARAGVIAARYADRLLRLAQ